MEKSNLGIFHFKTESYSLDFRGQLTMPMIGTYLLHAASCHAAERGFGYDEMNNLNTAWVLSRLAIEITNYSAMSREVTLYTWIEDATRLFTTRCFELKNPEGETFAYARSIWAAIDVDTRRPIPLDIEKLSPYILVRSCPIDKPGKISIVENEATGDRYKVKYSDLDINGHLNSMKYIEHLVDVFDLQLFEEKYINRMEIAYIAEGKYGMELSLHTAQVENNNYHLAICHEGKAICRASVYWN